MQKGKNSKKKYKKRQNAIWQNGKNVKPRK